MKAYTDLKQSKKLAEILPHITADGTWERVTISGSNFNVPEEQQYVHRDIPFTYFSGIGVPCWSLAALLNYLREIDFFPSIEINEHLVTMNVCYYDEEERKLLNPVHDITIEADNFVDACYKMILDLHEQKIL